MATTFKSLTTSDKVSTRTLLHEAIPLTGTILSGTYSDNNIKNFSHGMFQSVYDYPYLSSSANHIMDITVGYSADSSLSRSNSIQQSKKINIYNQMAQVLVGHDHLGAVLKFDQDGDIVSGGTKLNECFFLNFSRLLTKDEIKKGSFAITVMTGGTYAARTHDLVISDSGAANDYRVNSPAGEYAVLYPENGPSRGRKVGLIYYQAGIVVLTASLFGQGAQAGASLTNPFHPTTASNYFGDGTVSGKVDTSVPAMLSGSEISSSCNGFRNRLVNVAFNNTVELNSTIYFCRAAHNEFNYSANPTYLNSSKIRVKNESADSPVSYITTVGLFSADNEMMAVAKLSEPLKKDPTNELTLRVRLDY